MKHGKSIYKTLKAIRVDITRHLKLRKSDFFAGVSLGLMFFYATSCDLNNAPSVTNYLEQGYMPYSTFDEWSMKGDIKLAHVTDSCDDRIVLVKDEDSLVHVVRVNDLTHVLTYFKKDWGWYNRVSLKGDTSVYDRYILKDTVIELQIETLGDGRVYKNMYVKTRDKCTVAWLYDTCTWSGDELPQWQAMNKWRSTVFELRKGKRLSYYLPSTSWDNPKDYYVYPATDTTVFSRSPGLETGTIKHGRVHHKVDKFDLVMLDKNYNEIIRYKDEDGTFWDVEIEPRCIDGELALAHFVFQHSGSKVREMIRYDHIDMRFCISATGKVMRWELIFPRSNKKELENQICPEIPFNFEPATIFEQPVPCWYEIHIDARVIDYHRSDPVINSSSIDRYVDYDVKRPEFPGGEEALMKYIQSHIHYPPMAARNNIQGKVVVQLVVYKNGYVGIVKVVRSVDKDLDKEAVRICKTLPKFTPGRKDGIAVDMWYTVPVHFKLPK
jgi:TonB family protein